VTCTSKHQMYLFFYPQADKNLTQLGNNGKKKKKGTTRMLEEDERRPGENILMIYCCRKGVSGSGVSNRGNLGGLRTSITRRETESIHLEFLIFRNQQKCRGGKDHSSSGGRHRERRGVGPWGRKKKGVAWSPIRTCLSPMALWGCKKAIDAQVDFIRRQ